MERFRLHNGVLVKRRAGLIRPEQSRLAFPTLLPPNAMRSWQGVLNPFTFGAASGATPGIPLQFWYRADTGLGVDLSGNGYHIAGGVAPSYATDAAFNGQIVGTFNGTSTVVGPGSTTAVHWTGTTGVPAELCIWSVFKSVLNGGRCGVYSENASEQEIALLSRDPQNDLAIAGIIQFGSSVAGSARVVRIRTSASLGPGTYGKTTGQTEDATGGTYGTAANHANNEMCFGQNGPASAGAFFKGQFAECFGTAYHPTAPQRATVDTYLTTRYGFAA